MTTLVRQVFEYMPVDVRITLKQIQGLFPKASEGGLQSAMQHLIARGVVVRVKRGVYIRTAKQWRAYKKTAVSQSYARPKIAKTADQLPGPVKQGIVLDNITTLHGVKEGLLMLATITEKLEKAEPVEPTISDHHKALEEENRMLKRRLDNIRSNL